MMSESDPIKKLPPRSRPRSDTRIIERCLSRNIIHEKLENIMKQEPEDDDDEDFYLDEDIPQQANNPARVRSHARSLRAMANPSAVWAHFDLCINDPLRAQCRICGSVVVRGGANPRQCGTTNLHRHLRVHHGGRLIGRRYVVQSDSQGAFTNRSIKIGNKSLVRPQVTKIAPTSSTNTQKQPKTLVLKTIPLKVKQVASTTIKMPPRQQTSNIIKHQNVHSQQSPEVCLRWNSYHSNMQNSFPSLLDAEQFVDVTLACEGRSLKCHKMILSSCSDYLASLLRENPCQHPIILMKDLKFWEVEALVKFMYRGEVNVAHDKLPQLLNAAEALQVKGLAGPNPSPQNPKPPMLIPQPKPVGKSTTHNSRATTTETKETKQPIIKPPATTSSSSSPTITATTAPTSIPSLTSTSPKRVPKRIITEPMSSEHQPFTKIRLQRPSTPLSPNTTIKLEPLDIPLSPTDIFPDNNDDNSMTNYDNVMRMHGDDDDDVDDDDDPGGDNRLDSVDGVIPSYVLPRPPDLHDNDDHMEFVPTDFLDQDQDIIEEADGEYSKTSDVVNRRRDIIDHDIDEDDDDDDDDEKDREDNIMNNGKR
ncbi:hypothetical protein PV328_000384 [Microctonus aethiopoides]|uniref:Uncharacterized protein n=1 Tax=Microctonus aethiopoides TaxID=144406 RepID=A0AA39KWD3_9HYME|nr:hypothetical protein PV328_000384 [Microctonus aethiopoides]